MPYKKVGSCAVIIKDGRQLVQVVTQHSEKLEMLEERVWLEKCVA